MNLTEQLSKLKEDTLTFLMKSANGQPSFDFCLLIHAQDGLGEITTTVVNFAELNEEIKHQVPKIVEKITNDIEKEGKTPILIATCSEVWISKVKSIEEFRTLKDSDKTESIMAIFETSSGIEVYTSEIFRDEEKLMHFAPLSRMDKGNGEFGGRFSKFLKKRNLTTDRN